METVTTIKSVINIKLGQFLCKMNHLDNFVVNDYIAQKLPFLFLKPLQLNHLDHTLIPSNKKIYVWVDFVQNQSIFSDFLKMIHFAQFLPQIGSKFDTACKIGVSMVIKYQNKVWK